MIKNSNKYCKYHLFWENNHTSNNKHKQTYSVSGWKGDLVGLHYRVFFILLLEYWIEYSSITGTTVTLKYCRIHTFIRLMDSRKQKDRQKYNI